MKLHAPFVQLPLRFDAQRLADEVLAVEEAMWRPHPQGFPGNSMLPLVAVNGDPTNEEFAGQMRPTPELARCLYLRQVLASFGATVGRTRLMRLSGGAEVTRHADQFYYWTERVRIHVPIVTQPGVRFECGDSVVHMAAGECWIFDTWRQHRVLNEDPRARIHLVCDSVGGDAFWKMVSNGRPVGVEVHTEGWEPKPVHYDPAVQTNMEFERYNLPVVMSPWELERHLEFLLDEMSPSAQQAAMRLQVEVLYHGWRGLWASYADSVDAMPLYRRLLDRFLREVRPLTANLALRNELAVFPALMAGIARVALSSSHAPPMTGGIQRPPEIPYRH